MAAADRIYSVLFLCTGNSARSIFAEAILNKLGAGRFHAFSAGSHPAGTVNPHTIELLEKHRFPTEGLPSKSWEEFAQADAPHLDFEVPKPLYDAGSQRPLAFSDSAR